MKRREFIRTAAGAAAWPRGSEPEPSLTPAPPQFIPCINQATTMQADFRAALEAYHRAGFRAVELWLDSVEPFLKRESVAAARRLMADQESQPVSACCEGDVFFPRLEDRAKKLDSLKRKLDLSRELGARRFVHYSAIFEDVKNSDYDAALPGLAAVGDLGRERDIVVGIEFIKGAKFLGSVLTTVELLRRASHSHLGVQFDTFHFYAGISKLADLEKVRPGEISFVHINDVPAKPREILEDIDRVYVGDGVMPLERILRALAPVYQGYLSFEVFQYAAEDPRTVAEKSYQGLAALLTRLKNSAEEKPRTS
jgi:2-keto-myo-inositol isomerase